MQSVSISVNQWQSVAISGNQWQLATCRLERPRLLRLVLCAQVCMQSLGNRPERSCQPQLRLLVGRGAVLGAVRVRA